MCPMVHGKTLFKRRSLKLLPFDLDHILALRNVSFAFLVGPAKKIQSSRQVVVTWRARTSIGQIVWFQPCAISAQCNFAVDLLKQFPLRSLSIGMPKHTLRISVFHGHRAAEICLLHICCFDGAEHKLHDVAALISLFKIQQLFFLKSQPFLFPSLAVLRWRSVLRAMLRSSERLCPLPRKGLQITAWTHLLKHTTSY